MPNRFSQAVAIICANKDISVEQFAKTINCTLDELRSYKKGSKTPSHTMLEILHAQYNMNINWLIMGHGEMFLPKSSTTQTVSGDNNGNIIGGNVNGDVLATGAKKEIHHTHNYYYQQPSKVENLDQDSNSNTDPRIKLDLVDSYNTIYQQLHSCNGAIPFTCADDLNEEQFTIAQDFFVFVQELIEYSLLDVMSASEKTDLQKDLKAYFQKFKDNAMLVYSAVNTQNIYNINLECLCLYIDRFKISEEFDACIKYFMCESADEREAAINRLVELRPDISKDKLVESFEGSILHIGLKIELDDKKNILNTSEILNKLYDISINAATETPKVNCPPLSRPI